MRIQVDSNSVKLWASANDTYAWANRPGARWPGSMLAGNRFFAEFDTCGLIDFALNGGRGSDDVDGREFSACVADLLHESGKVPADHPARFVAIDQHR